MVTLLGFKVDDSELKRFTVLTDNAKAKINTFFSSLAGMPPVDDSSIRQLGDTIDRANAKAESLGSQAITVPPVDDTSLNQLGKTIDDASQKIYEMGDGKTIRPLTDTKPMEKLGAEVDSARQKTESLTGALLKANLIMAAVSRVVGAAFSFVRDSVIGATAETERYRVTLGTMIGDQEKANKIIHKLDYSPLSDFYGTAAAIGGLQSMVTFGMQAETAGDILSRLGDIAQGDSAAFQSLSLNMGQVFAKGKADGMDLKQFVTQGFNVVGEIEKITGKSREEIEKAGVSYELTKKALENLTNAGGKYNGMLAKQMNTLGGVLKQFASFKAATAEAIGLGVSDSLKELLKYILEIGRAGQESFVGIFVKALKEVIHWIFQIIIMWEVLGFRLAEMGDALTPVRGFFSSLRDVAGDILTGIMKLVVALGKAFLALSVPISAYLTPIIETFGRIAKKVLTEIGEVFDEITPVFLEWSPIFDAIGKAIGDAYEKIIPVLDNVKDAIIAVITPIKAFLTPIVESLQPLYEKIFGAIGKLFKQAGEDTNGLADAIKGLTPLFSALGNIAAFLIDIFGTGLGWIIESLGPFLKYILLIAGAIKVWSIVQGILNAVMAMNPIAQIIMVIAALIMVIGLLVKNWDKVKEGFANAGKAIGNFFSGAGERIKSFASSVGEKVGGAFSSIIDFFKKWGEVILQILAVVIFGIPGLVAVAVRQIIKHWGVIGPKIKAILGKIKAFFAALGRQIASIFQALVNKIRQAFQWVVDRAIAILGTLKSWFSGLVEDIKGIWLSITGWFTGLWNGIVNTAMEIWDTLKSWFAGLVEGIKNIWYSITDFFSGLWEAIQEGPAAAIEYIKTAFLDLFSSIQEKLFGFINKIREGWETVKGFFGGIGEGVVNFFTGGDSSGGGQMQPVYAGSTSQAAMAGAVGQTSSYAYTTMGGNSTVNAQTSINVNVPPGTPQEQNEAIARQVRAQFDAKLADSINSSRANIPSPEVRRH